MGADPSPPAWRRGERGFTLLEVLVAFVIAALALGVLVQGASTGLFATRTALRYEEALARAQSHLAALDGTDPLAAGEMAGDDGGGYRWSRRVAALVAAPQGPGGEPVPMLYAVSVVVSWRAYGQERLVRLDTRRLGIAPPPPP